MIPSFLMGDSVAARLALLAEQGFDQVSDILQALRWARPNHPELEDIYNQLNTLNDRFEQFREDDGLAN